MWNVELCAQQLSELRRSDPGAFGALVALMETSMSEGLPARYNGDGYRVPVGDRVDRAAFRGREMPWLGELRVDERTPRKPSKPGNAREHRLYFGEPGDPADLVLGAGMGGKRGKDRDASDKQTRQMRDAMWSIIRWCEGMDPPTSWRVWNWDC